MALADFQTLVDDLVRDKDQVVSSTERDLAIANAVVRFSEVRPREIVTDEIQAGGRGYRVALPSEWVDDTSDLRSVEYPVGTTPDPDYLPMSSVSLYRTPSGQQISLPCSVSDGETVRVTFTVPHTLDVSTDTIPEKARAAVCYLAASIICDQLANHYATEGEPTLGADTVEHKTKSDRFRSRAKDLKERFDDFADVSEPGVKPALSVGDMDRPLQVGWDRLFHGRNRR